LGDDEIAALAEVVRSGQLCQGQTTEQFEEKFARRVGVRHAVAVSSGSAALLVAMQALGVQAGDEVIVPDITFVSTATAAVYLGAKPVFCDISLDNYCIDTDKVAGLITSRTKLIVPVHLGGRVADVEALRPIASRHRLAVLEDAAGAHGASRCGRMAGAMGDAAIFSFTPTKLMTTGEGGMITTDDAALAARCRSIRNFGDEGKFAWNSLGFNFRMSALSAALGIEQLDRLDDHLRQRRALAARYASAFRDVAGVRAPRNTREELPNHQLYPVLCNRQQTAISRDTLMQRLKQRRIATRLYYPPLHRMPVFARWGPYSHADFPAAERYASNALCLPIFPGMNDAQQQHVIDSLCEIVAGAPADFPAEAT